MPATVYVMLLALSISGAPEPKHWHDNDDRGTHWQDREDDDDRDGDARAGGCLFEPNDLRVLTSYYAPERRSLLSGPNKMIYRMGYLPPGSEGKIVDLPLLVEVRMAPLPHNYRRGVIDGYAIIYDPGTRMIMDVAVVFGSH